MDAGTALVEDLFGPPAIGFGAQGQIAVKRLQEIGILAAHIGDDFAAVRRQSAKVAPGSKMRGRVMLP